jgi:hypothetical protein
MHFSSLLIIATLIVVDFRCALECSEDGGLQFMAMIGITKSVKNPAVALRMISWPKHRGRGVYE